MAEITFNLKEFGIVPIHIKSHTVTGFVDNKYFSFPIENPKHFKENKSIYEESLVGDLREQKQCQK